VLQIEWATLSGIVATLVRKGLIDQLPGSEDQRQRVLRLTGDGTRLCAQLPDPSRPKAASTKPGNGEKINTLISNGPWLCLIPACVFCSFMSSLVMGHRAAV
jgi:DNA-binding MarR family transcriptional regulator